MGFQERDLSDLMFSLLKPRNMLFVLKAFFYKQGGTPKKDDF
jgi:hypothetical protein